MRQANAPWPQTPAPGIDTEISQATLRAMKDALRAVDKDIERTGSVSAESVDLVRAAREMLRK